MGHVALSLKKASQRDRQDHSGERWERCEQTNQEGRGAKAGQEDAEESRNASDNADANAIDQDAPYILFMDVCRECRSRWDRTGMATTTDQGAV